MSAYVVIVIKDTNSNITQLNDKLQNAVGAEAHNLINLAADYLNKASMGGISAATVQVVTRDTDPSVSTSGSSSQTVTVSIG
jgi:hypothetical protein